LVMVRVTSTRSTFVVQPHVEDVSGNTRLCSSTRCCRSSMVLILEFGHRAHDIERVERQKTEI
jgi:hypothetical protein